MRPSQHDLDLMMEMATRKVCPAYVNERMDPSTLLRMEHELNLYVDQYKNARLADGAPWEYSPWYQEWPRLVVSAKGYSGDVQVDWR